VILPKLDEALQTQSSQMKTTVEACVGEFVEKSEERFSQLE
jgi:hypothetical protein